VTPPRWGVQTGAVQPRRPAFWLFVLAVGVGLVFFVPAQAAALRVSAAGWILSWLLLLLYVVPVVLVVRWLDQYEPEPRSLLVAAFLWGALVATFFAGLGNELWGAVVTRVAGPEFASRWSDAITAPPLEEIYKYLGLIVFIQIARAEFDDLIDGFVYGALIGLGFAVVEDVMYFMFQFGGTPARVFEGFFVRVVASGLYTHVLFTGIAGIGLAYFVRHSADRPRAVRVGVAAGLVLLAIVAHFVWNAPWLNDLPLLLLTAFKGLPFLFAGILLLRLARRREDDDLALVLGGEVGHSGLLEHEMSMLRSRRARSDAAERIRRAAGPAAERLFRKLQSEQMRLALVSSATDSPDDPDLLRQRAACESLRQRLLAIPGVDAALGPAADGAQRPCR
jgi:RsiW-degrading membrane proteinase PrsW (M82 family)